MTGAAYGELTVLRTPEPLAKWSRKRSRTQPAAEQARDQPDRRCERIVTVDIAELGLSVEMKRRTITRGSRVLLGALCRVPVTCCRANRTANAAAALTVVDWIDEVETTMAARDAVMQLGGDVVGVSVVVAAGSHLLQILKAAQIPYACAWTPPFGGELAIGSRRHGSGSAPHGRKCICHRPQDGLKATDDEGLQLLKDAPKRTAPRLAHFTAQYQVRRAALAFERDLSVWRPVLTDNVFCCVLV